MPQPSLKTAKPELLSLQLIPKSRSHYHFPCKALALNMSIIHAYTHVSHYQTAFLLICSDHGSHCPLYDCLCSAPKGKIRVHHYTSC